MKPRTPTWLLRILMALSLGLGVLTLTNVMATAIPNRDGEEDWVDALTNAVMIHRKGGGGYPGGEVRTVSRPTPGRTHAAPERRSSRHLSGHESAHGHARIP